VPVHRRRQHRPGIGRSPLSHLLGGRADKNRAEPSGGRMAALCAMPNILGAPTENPEAAHFKICLSFFRPKKTQI